MKKTQFIDLITTIKNTLVSFCSITMFVALGVSIFLGMGWSATSLSKSVKNAQDQNNFRDLEIITPYGFTDSELDKIRKVEGVKTVEGTYTYYGYFSLGGTKYQAKLCTIPKKLNTLFYVEGSMPTLANEVVVERSWAELYGLKVGDSITFLHDATSEPHALSILLENEDKIGDVQAMINLFNEEEPKACGMQALNYDTFRVAALAESPDYISNFAETYGTSATLNTPINCIMFLPEEAFDARSFAGYNDIHVKSTYLDGLYSDSKFRDQNEEFKDRVDVVVKELSSAKNARIVNIATNLKTKLEEAPTLVKEYREQIISGQREISIYERLVNEGKKRIGDASTLLNQARNELESRIAQYRELYERFKAALPTVEEMKEKLDKAGDIIEKGVEVLKSYKDHPEKLEETKNFLNMLFMMAQMYHSDDAETIEVIQEYVNSFIDQWQAAISDIDYEALAARIPEFKEKLFEVLSQKDRVISAGEKFVQDARNKVATYIRQLTNGQSDLDSGQQQINTGKEKIAEYEEQVTNAELMLEGPIVQQFRVAVSDLKDYSSAILTIANNPTNAATLTITEILSRTKLSLASLFFIVGILVCYSALSRIVYSHMKLLGTKKALGLSKGEITRSYLYYGASTAIVGSILGGILGYFAIQPTIMMALRRNYVFKQDIFHIDFLEFLIIFLVELVIILLSTYVACRRILREQPVTLLAGPTPSDGRARFYEKSKLWKRLSLFSKTMFNNFFTDKRRVIGTLIGITGCTAMLVCGMVINLNSIKSSDIMFNELNPFDTLIMFDGKQEGAKDKIQKVLEENNIESSSFASYCIRMVLPDDRVNICYVYASDDENFPKFFKLKTDKGNLKEITDGARLVNGFGQSYNIDSGDKIEFIDNTGQHFFIPYIGEFESYLPRIIAVTSAETYTRYSKTDYYPTSFTVDLRGKDKEALLSQLKDIPGFITLYDYVSINKAGFNSVSSCTIIVALLAIILATIMAFLVLLNLFAMHVEEKKRELIILMINGYSLKYAKKYVYKDTIFLTVIGIILGSVLGQLAGDMNIQVFSYLPAHFYSGLNWLSILFGVVMAALLAFINSKIALRRINKFNLTDINK
ncbi:MAG: FtsX-like permease family protein [Lachnospiraceae bacterium]|nr:FtsX-like permease family protein [Lachnospiraceae bacterium]